MKTLHCEQPQEKRDQTGTVQFMTDPYRTTWRSLISNFLCMGKDSQCVKGTCEVMCAYGKRYIKEKEQHAG